MPSNIGTLTTACVTHIDGFRALAEEWGRLHDACPESTPFNSWEWLFSWWQTYGDGKELCVLTCRSEGQLVGIAPLYLVSESAGIGVRVQAMRMLGDASADSDYLDFLIRPEMRSAVLPALDKWLAGDGRWDVLALRELPASSPVSTLFERTAASRKLSIRVEHGLCGAVALPDTFDEFLQSRQPRFRTKLRALLKKLDQGQLQLETHAAPGTLRRRLRSLFTLHQARWRDAGAEGVFAQRAKRAFYAHFAPRFARRGWLRLYSLRSGERYVAHQLCFGMRGVTYLLQEGFDVTDPAASYGQMLRGAVMRHLIEHGEGRYDFLGGISRHKQDWGAQPRNIVHLVMARPRSRAWLYFKMPLWRERSAIAAKRWLPTPAVRMLKRTREAFS